MSERKKANQLRAQEVIREQAEIAELERQQAAAEEEVEEKRAPAEAEYTNEPTNEEDQNQFLGEEYANQATREERRERNITEGRDQLYALQNIKPVYKVKKVSQAKYLKAVEKKKEKAKDLIALTHNDENRKKHVAPRRGFKDETKEDKRAADWKQREKAGLALSDSKYKNGTRKNKQTYVTEGKKIGESEKEYKYVQGKRVAAVGTRVVKTVYVVKGIKNANGTYRTLARTERKNAEVMPLVKAILRSIKPDTTEQTVTMRTYNVTNPDSDEKSFRTIRLTTTVAGREEPITEEALAENLMMLSQEGTTSYGSDATPDNHTMDAGWFQMSERSEAIFGARLSKPTTTAFFKTINVKDVSKGSATMKSKYCLFDALIYATGVLDDSEVKRLREVLNMPGGVPWSKLQQASTRLGIPFRLMHAPKKTITYEKKGDKEYAKVEITFDLWESEGVDVNSPMLVSVPGKDGGMHIVNYVSEAPKRKYDRETGHDITDRKPLTRAEKNKILVRQGRPELQKETKKQGPQPYIFYDIETVASPYEEGLLKAYSLSYLRTDVDGKPDGRVRTIIKEELSGCVAEFITILGSITTPHRLVSFNGSRFDDIILYREARNQNIAVSNMLLTSGLGGGMLSLTIGLHKTLDLARFVPGQSLAKVCENFGTKARKMEGFDHDEVQEAHDNDQTNGLKLWIVANEEKLREYNEGDVSCLAEVFFKIRDLIKENTDAEIGDFMTISQYAYTMHKQAIVEKLKKREEEQGECEGPIMRKYRQYSVSPKTEEDDKLMRASMYAGRCQLYQGPIKYFGKMASIDVTSMYPAMMLDPNNVYPVGDYKHTEKEIPGKMGIYNVHILTQPTVRVVPERRKDGSLNWAPQNSMDAIINSVDLETLRKAGGIVLVKSGIYWDKCESDYFPTQMKLRKMKEEEENKPEGEQNPSKIAFIKICLNSLSGKVGQRMHLTAMKVISTTKEDEAFRSKHTDIETYEGSSTWSIVTGTKRAGWTSNKASPVYLASFIYAYARRRLYDIVGDTRYATSIFYSDTDSVMLKYEAYIALKEENPEWFPTTKIFGCWAEELGATGDRCKAYFIRPKLYAIFGEDIPNSKKSKWKVKAAGIRENDIMLDSTLIAELDKEQKDIAAKYCGRQEASPRDTLPREGDETLPQDTPVLNIAGGENRKMLGRFVRTHHANDWKAMATIPIMVKVIDEKTGKQKKDLVTGKPLSEVKLDETGKVVTETVRMWEEPRLIEVYEGLLSGGSMTVLSQGLRKEIANPSNVAIRASNIKKTVRLTTRPEDEERMITNEDMADLYASLGIVETLPQEEPHIVSDDQFDDLLVDML